MEVTDKFIVTTKINHDSIWAKATFPDKSYVRFSITRSSIGSRGNANPTNFQILAGTADNMFKAWKNRSPKDSGFSVDTPGTYGELISMVVKAWTKISETARPSPEVTKVDKFTVTYEALKNNLWVQATFSDGTYARFGITKSGNVVIRGNACPINFHALDRKAREVYADWKDGKTSVGTYYDLIEAVEKAWAKISEGGQI